MASFCWHTQREANGETLCSALVHTREATSVMEPMLHAVRLQHTCCCTCIEDWVSAVRAWLIVDALCTRIAASSSITSKLPLSASARLPAAHLDTNGDVLGSSTCEEGTTTWLHR